MSQFQLDGTKLIHHAEALAAWQRGDVVYPVLVEISPTNTCNHGCLFCSYDYIDGRSSRDAVDKSGATFLDADRLIEVIDELAALGTKSLFYSGEGEPLLHKRLPEIIEHAGARGLEQALNTNGVALRNSTMRRVLPHLSWIRFSINGVNEGDYALNHRAPAAHFARVIENLETAAAFKAREGLAVALGVQCVHMGQTPTEILAFAQRVKSIGASYFSLKQFNEHPSNPYAQAATPQRDAFLDLLALSDDGFQAHVRLPFGEAAPRRPYRRCLGLPFLTEIVASGEVYACGPHLGEKAFCYGSIHEADFKTLWSHENRRKVEQHVAGIADLDHTCMPNCRLNEVNKLLWSLANPPEHVNFI